MANLCTYAYRPCGFYFIYLYSVDLLPTVGARSDRTKLYGGSLRVGILVAFC